MRGGVWGSVLGCEGRSGKVLGEMWRCEEMLGEVRKSVLKCG